MNPAVLVRHCLCKQSSQVGKAVVTTDRRQVQCDNSWKRLDVTMTEKPRVLVPISLSAEWNGRRVSLSHHPQPPMTRITWPQTASLKYRHYSVPSTLPQLPVLDFCQPFKCKTNRHPRAVSHPSPGDRHGHVVKTKHLLPWRLCCFVILDCTQNISIFWKITTMSNSNKQHPTSSTNLQEFLTNCQRSQP